MLFTLPKTNNYKLQLFMLFILVYCHGIVEWSMFTTDIFLL